MNVLPQSRPTRLRDYGAFETDVSLWPTQEMQSVVTRERAPEQIIPFPVPRQFAEKALESERGKSKRSKLTRSLNLFGRLLITCVLLFMLLRSISWETLFGALGHIRQSLVLLGLTVGAFCIVVSSYQWRGQLAAERIRRDLASLVNLYLVGIAFSHFLPTGMGGDAVKAVYVGRASGNGAGSASAVIMSRVTGFFGMLLLALPVFLIWHQKFRGDLILWFLVLSVGVGGAIALALTSAVVVPRLALVARPGALRRLDRLLTEVGRVGNALKKAFSRPVSLCTGTLVGALFWIVSCLNYYAYAYAIGMNVPLYFYCVAIPFISLLAMLPITINGFGVREGAFVYVFSMMHVSAAHALLLALFMDAQVLLFGLAGGGIYFFMKNGMWDSV